MNVKNFTDWQIKIALGVIMALIITTLSYYTYANLKAGDISQNVKENVKTLSPTLSSALSHAKTLDTIVVYETEAESTDECSSYETFDPETKTCYFECNNKQECTDMEQSINDEVNSWTDDKYSDTKVDEKAPGNVEKNVVAEYKVHKGEQISLKLGTTGPEDMSIWKHISNIAPDDFTNKYVETFQVFNDTNSDVLAFVDDEDQSGKWRISVNQAGYDSSTVRERNLTIVHELGHIVVLNVSQIKQSEESTCKNYFTAEGCANSSSYINLFTHKFWSESDISKSKQENSQSGSVLYKQNKFVTEYASTNPEEDMAESFSYFVIEKKNQGNYIKDQKSAFYYQFPELVTMRDSMRVGVSSDVVRAKMVKGRF